MKLRKRFFIFSLFIIFILGSFYGYIYPKYEVPILMYHHIDQEQRRSLLSVSLENFHSQIYFLSRHNYNVISLAEFVQARVNREKLARNTVVLTFDDGYEDNFLFAYPVLKKFNFPATLFVIVDSIGKRDFLTNRQIKEMAASGIIEIGSHSLTHAYLPGLDRQALEQEIGLSKKVLEAKIDKKVNLFAYPIGFFSPQIQELLKEYGYQAACTTNRGKVQTYLNNDLFALKRIKAKDNRFYLLVFWAKVSGYYNVFRSVREPY